MKNFRKNKMNITAIHMIHGLKTALAGVLAYSITLFFNMEFGYWAVISTVIVMQIYVAEKMEMCLYRLSGTIIGAICDDRYAFPEYYRIWPVQGG